MYFIHQFVETVIVLFFVHIIVSVVSHSKNEVTPKVLMISFDGFRWDYLNRPNIPEGTLKHFEKFIKQGVTAKRGLTNAFITKTFPNHYTLVTGLWEESHGIVGNVMYDPVLNETFDKSNITEQKDPKWFDNGGEPIWVTNQLQNNVHRSGVIMWPGESAAVKGVLPTKYIPYNPLIKNETKIETMLEWFTMQYPINLGLLYFNEPDSTGHKYGPESPQIDRMIIALDNLTGFLLEQFEKKNLLDKIDIIITSDHGFASTPPDKVINLNKYIDRKDYKIFQSTPIANILPNPGKEDEIYSALVNASKTEHFKVYKKENIPEHFHYKHNRRIQPILIVTEEHYSIKTHPSMPLGDHGWDNRLPDMHPVFLAMGPSFKSNYAVDTFNSVDIYGLLCHVLHLDPAPNNGSFDHIRDLLKKSSEENMTTWVTFGTYIFVLVIIALVGGVYMVAACRVHRYLKRKHMYSLSSLPNSIKSSVKFGTDAKMPLLSESEEDFP